MPAIALTAELEAAHLEELHVAAAKIENAREDRDEAIKGAVWDGVPVAKIATEVGLTRARVYQIVR